MVKRSRSTFHQGYIEIVGVCCFMYVIFFGEFIYVVIILKVLTYTGFIPLLVKALQFYHGTREARLSKSKLNIMNWT